MVESKEVLMRMDQFKENPMDEMMSKLSKKVAWDSQQEIIRQLDDFVSRGLIHVEETHGTLSRHMDDVSGKMTLTYIHGVKLVLKDREYIVELEEKVKKLEFENQEFKRAINGIAEAAKKYKTEEENDEKRGL